MNPRRRTTICREGWYYLVVLGLVFTGAMLKDVNLLLMLAGMMAGPLLFSWRLVVTTLRGLEAHRKVPHGVCAGDLMVVHVDLRNTRRHYGSWAVVVEDEIRLAGDNDREPRLRPSVLFSYVPAGESRRAAYRGRLARRGRYVFGPLRISTRFPFGLFYHTVTLGATEEVIVLPRLGRLARNWIARRHEAFMGNVRREQRAGLSGDFFGLRPWRPGDSQRWIHWRSLARHGELHVRQFEQPRNRDLAVLVDLWQPRLPDARHEESVEIAVSFAATVLAELCRTGGSHLVLGIAGRETVTIDGPAGPVFLQESLEALAVAESDTEERLPGLLEKALPRIDAASDVLLLSPRPVNLGDQTRFGGLGWGTHRRQLIGRIRTLDTSSEALAEFFETE